MLTLSHPIARAIAAGLLMVIAGCGSEPTVVKGTVKLDGQPLEAGRIEFHGLDESRAVANASITAGKYELPENRKLSPGEYQVRLFANVRTGKQIRFEGQLTDEIVEGAPEKYNEKSELKRTLKLGDNSLDFDIQSNKK